MTIRAWVLQLIQIIMSKKSYLYNETKATQVAAILLKLNGGSMPFYKCIKLLYSIERESLNRWLHPTIYDELCSMPHGQVVSQTLDRAKYRKGKVISFWNEYLKTIKDETIKDETENKTLILIKECGIDKLSRAEIDLIKEVYKLNKDKTVPEIIAEHHNSTLFPEWKDPGSSRIPTKYSDLLKVLGKTQEQVEELEADLDELTKLKDLAC